MKNYRSISYTVSEGTGHIVLNQPPSNVMDACFFTEFSDLTEELRNEDLKALIISGAGRHFSSGAKTDELVKIIGEEKNSSDFFQKNLQAFQLLADAAYPVIAAINGVCIGSAMELALFCHFRFCGEESVLGLPETTFNLVPGIGGVTNFVKLAGKAKAAELILRGNTFSASEALEYGLVDIVLPRKEVMSEAFRFARYLKGRYYKEKKPLYLKRFRENG